MKTKIIREFLDVERDVVINIDTLETRCLTDDEKKKYNGVGKTQGATNGFQESSR